MSEFDLAIQKARGEQRKLYGLMVGGFAAVSLALTGFFTYSSGTLIRISPDDASEIGSVSVISGIGFAISDYVYAFGNEPKILVSAQGFSDQERTLTAEEKGGVIDVPLEELPGELVVRTAPEHELSKWKIDDEHATTSLAFSRVLTPGTYKLEVDNPYFEIETREVIVERDKQIELLVKLKPVEGRISISSRPSGSIVNFDGASVGSTPITLMATGGVHQVEVQERNYKTTSESIEITNSEKEIVRDYRLVRPPASVSFKVDPPNGTLLLNGKKTAPDEPHTVSANIENTITYILDGYYPKTQKLTLGASESKLVVIRLEPEIGTVDIQTEPTVTVLVNEVPVGKSPIVLELPSIGHSIKLRRAGYRTIGKNIVPSSKHITMIREKLVTEKVGRLSESPKRYTNGDGISLLLFEPSDIEMGAPRHETGAARK